MLNVDSIKAIIGIVITLTLTNCNSEIITKQDQPFEIINIDPTKTNLLTDYSKLISDIDFIRLESTPNNSIDWISKLWVNEDFLIINSGNMQIQTYSPMGKFKFSKGKEGKGKNEIKEIKDFCPGPNESIYILGYKEIYKIDQLGALVDVFPMTRPYESFNPDYFHIINNHYHLYSTSATGAKQNQTEQFSLWFKNQDNKHSGFFLKRKTCNLANNAFLQCNEKILITPVLGIDTIYTFYLNTVIPAIYVNFGKYKVVPEEVPDDQISPYPIFRYAIEHKKCLNIYAPLMNDSNILFLYFYNNNYYFVIYNKTDKSVINFEVNADLQSNLLFMTSPLAFYHNKLYYSLPAHKIRDLMDDNNIGLNFLPNIRRLQLLEKLKDVKETDNPVLMLVTFKDQ